MKVIKSFFLILPTVVVIIAAAIIYNNLTTNKTIEELLSENTELKEAISNLEYEEQIGYAKVLAQYQRDDKLYTKLLFVETVPGDPSSQVLRKEFEIEGDVVHFDAIIVKFSGPLVTDGKERALYMWRRVYGESMSPEQGLPIETEGLPSVRYESLCRKLSIEDNELFWSQLWNLSNDPKKLEPLGVKAIFGNVVYKRLKPGLVYIFKVNSSGNLYPETIPDF
ncbi:MAG: hypothetical protein ACIAQZ_16495 [Sedimentisphaeraceae bacterium JB056]